MIAYRFLEPAQEEMREAALFYNEKSVGLGVEFVNDVEQNIQRIRRHPLLGVEKEKNIRFKLLSRFPFTIIYALELNTIIIIAVAHHRRRPGYWKHRSDT